MMTTHYYISGKSGCGCFLNPPGHPAHNHHDHSIDSFSSIESDYEWYPESVKEQCKKLLSDWDKSKLPLTDETVKDWVHHVLGYFKGCYKNDNLPEPLVLILGPNVTRVQMVVMLRHTPE